MRVFAKASGHDSGGRDLGADCPDVQVSSHPETGIGITDASTTASETPVWATIYSPTDLPPVRREPAPSISPRGQGHKSDCDGEEPFDTAQLHKDASPPAGVDTKCATT